MQQYMATGGVHKAVPTQGVAKQSVERAVDEFLNKHNVMMPGFIPGTTMQSVRPLQAQVPLHSCVAQCTWCECWHTIRWR